MAFLEKGEVLGLYRREVDAPTYQKIRELWKAHSIHEDNRNIDGILATLTEDCRYVVVNSSLEWNSRKGAAQFYQELLTAIPNAKFELQRIVIGPQGVFEEAVLTGHHKGPFRGFAPTNQPVKSSVAILFPWDESAELFSGERIYADLSSIFGGTTPHSAQ